VRKEGATRTQAVTLGMTAALAPPGESVNIARAGRCGKDQMST
jgi:hypothetical protein